MQLELNDFTWRLACHTPSRVKVFIYTAPGLGSSLRSALSRKRIRSSLLSPAVVVVYAAADLVKVLRACSPTANREPLSSALDRYELAWKNMAHFRKGSAEERRECQRATAQVCEALGVAYKGGEDRAAWDEVVP